MGFTRWGSAAACGRRGTNVLRCVWSLQVVRDTVIFSPVDPKIPSEDCFVNGKPFSLPDREWRCCSAATAAGGTAIDLPSGAMPELFTDVQLPVTLKVQ